MTPEQKLLERIIAIVRIEHDLYHLNGHMAEAAACRDLLPKLMVIREELSPAAPAPASAEREKRCNLGGHFYPGIGPNGFTCTSDCEHGCGCWMGGSRSGGPEGVDPFGECPANPHTVQPQPAGDELVPMKMRTAAFMDYINDEAKRGGNSPGAVLDGEIAAFHKLKDDSRWPQMPPAIYDRDRTAAGRGE